MAASERTGTPVAAHYSRRSWQYREETENSRGKSIARWYPQSRYKPHELASPEFTKLRTEFLQRNPQLTGLIAALQLDDTLH